ncbi:MAG: NAD(P)(+) transhydrogenase (Re/Si-specific) subunit beta [Candidatus Scalindua sp.]|jgi:NAD(P) transhydrogenase subunit beta|nr:NAD(P)(+) transhydrogenase (Re/Si-specific) subunit beta [Candidatus Scalindua sp.]
MKTIIVLAYLLSSVLFILGLKNLSSPKTARRGNLFAMIAMLIAIIATLIKNEIVDFTFIITGLIIGSTIGVIIARRVSMTAMPQMVALFNGLGGGASAFVALAEYYRLTGGLTTHTIISMIISFFVGAVTLTGSLVAFGKLQGIIKSAPVVFKAQRFINMLIFTLFLITGIMVVINPANSSYLLAVLAIAMILGILLVIPIGGADMPVVISSLNSCSGLAAAATGFVLSNNILIICGALVGASGMILTRIMCKAMNRSISNIIFGAVGTISSDIKNEEKQKVVAYTEEDALMMLESAQTVIVIPGYGLAVAQAQFALQELVKTLINSGIKARYAIHPVAGRMPGHMNVLLAEANVSYDLLFDLGDINNDFQSTDVALVVGANDVVNPSARADKDSPLYGMPILNADQAKTVIICKRSLSPGFSGVDNELFYNKKTMMIFGDAKDSINRLIKLLKP